MGWVNVLILAVLLLKRLVSQGVATAYRAMGLTCVVVDRRIVVMCRFSRVKGREILGMCGQAISLVRAAVSLATMCAARG